MRPVCDRTAFNPALFNGVVLIDGGPLMGTRRMIVTPDLYAAFRDSFQAAPRADDAISDDNVRRCEGCNGVAVTTDPDDVPLCRPCAKACDEPVAESVRDALAKERDEAREAARIVGWAMCFVPFGHDDTAAKPKLIFDSKEHAEDVARRQTAFGIGEGARFVVRPITWAAERAATSGDHPSAARRGHEGEARGGAS